MNAEQEDLILNKKENDFITDDIFNDELFNLTPSPQKFPQQPDDVKRTKTFSIQSSRSRHLTNQNSLLKNVNLQNQIRFNQRGAKKNI